MILSTHVLDTMHGVPAAGMKVELHQVSMGGCRLLREIILDQDGRAGGGALPLEENARPGTYRLLFYVADYFRLKHVQLPVPPFLDRVPLDFGIAGALRRYHVPLLVTPWSYSTYRGS